MIPSYTSLGITNKTALALAGVWGTVLLPAIIIGGYFFDKIGRKRSVYVSMGIVMTASTMLTVSWSRYSASGNTNKTAGHVAVASMFLFIFGYSWIMNAMQFTYPAEICPANIRHIGTAFVQTVGNIWIIIIVQVAPIAIAAIGWKFFMIFLFFDLITLSLVIFL
jgi:MFS family permease